MNAEPFLTLRTIEKSDLLPALLDQRLYGISFLNEIIDRFPDAISFAPGAPFNGFFDDLDVEQYIQTYAAYLEKTKGLTPQQVRRSLYQYGPSQGQINELLADSLRIDQNIDVPASAVIVTVGCQEAMTLVLRALCSRPSDVLAVVNPSFIGILGAASVLGVEVVPIDELEDSFSFDSLREVCAHARSTGRRVRALYVAPDYSNPGGAHMTLDARQRLLALADEEDLLLLEDNAYGFTASNEHSLPTLKALDKYQRVIYFGTCAKVCLPGVRVGFAVADQSVRGEDGKLSFLSNELALIKNMVTVNTSPICQAIVGGMILENGGSLTSVGKEKAVLYRKNLQYLLESLDRNIDLQLRWALGISWNHPNGGFFLRMKLPITCDDTLLNYSAKKFGVLWTPMHNFYIGNGGRNDIRLSCSYLTLDQIEQGVIRLTRFLKDVCKIEVTTSDLHDIK